MLIKREITIWLLFDRPMTKPHRRAVIAWRLNTHIVAVAVVFMFLTFNALGCGQLRAESKQQLKLAGMS